MRESLAASASAHIQPGEWNQMRGVPFDWFRADPPADRRARNRPPGSAYDPPPGSGSSADHGHAWIQSAIVPHAGRQPSRRAGRVRIAVSVVKSACTQTPTSRKGSAINHTSGKASNTRSASGQHRRKRTHQTRNVRNALMLALSPWIAPIECSLRWCASAEVVRHR